MLSVPEATALGKVILNVIEKREREREREIIFGRAKKKTKSNDKINGRFDQGIASIRHTGTNLTGKWKTFRGKKSKLVQGLLEPQPYRATTFAFVVAAAAASPSPSTTMTTAFFRAIDNQAPSTRS